MGPLQVGPALPEQRQSMMRVAQSRLEHAERQFHEATEAEQAKLQKQLDRRRLRETKIPWIDAYALVVGRLALHGPLTARRGARVHAQLERMLGDALGKLGVTAGHTVLAEHATTLEQAIADAQQYLAATAPAALTCIRADRPATSRFPAGSECALIVSTATDRGKTDV